MSKTTTKDKKKNKIESKVNKIIEEIKQLEDWQRDDILFKLLDKGIVDFIQISNAYIAILKKKRKQQWEIINHLSIALSAYDMKSLKGREEFIREKSALYIFKGKAFSKSKYHKELKKRIKEMKYHEKNNES